MQTVYTSVFDWCTYQLLHCTSGCQLLHCCCGCQLLHCCCGCQLLHCTSAWRMRECTPVCWLLHCSSAVSCCTAILIVNCCTAFLDISCRNAPLFVSCWIALVFVNCCLESSLSMVVCRYLAVSLPDKLRPVDICVRLQLSTIASQGDSSSSRKALQLSELRLKTCDHSSMWDHVSLAP